MEVIDLALESFTKQIIDLLSAIFHPITILIALIVIFFVFSGRSEGV